MYARYTHEFAEVVLAAILDKERAKSCENASKRYGRAIISGDCETALFVFHFWSRASDRK